MSLNRMGLGTVVAKQLQYKMKAYIGVFSSLVLVQVIAVLLSLGGNGSGSSSIYGLSINSTLYMNVNVIAFTFMWIFIHAIMMTTKAERENGFSFVSNQLSNNISNSCLLLIASIIGGITTILSGYLLRVIVYFFIDVDLFIGTEFYYPPVEVLQGIIAMVSYLVFASSIGYLLGIITQLNRMLPVLLPIILIGMLIAMERAWQGAFLKIGEFYFQETNVFLFLFKFIGTAVICFVAAILLSNRLEVRK
ncbi:hypothetical protein [Oceanobacillus chungangensis]|uniref:Uncharacterized protein n=1 Tax=Oceanobacillus chungangensis TaxID=1229152 RepID=A0A3D8PYN5_9BACI|nr:hypothetical protein [Oceanobacillus chungangensis]RDW21266.1 hypothetical protein CWR45_03215 [Oceanobacillus chungangensis]